MDVNAVVDKINPTIETVEITDNPFDKIKSPDSWAIWEKNSAGEGTYPFFKRIMKSKSLKGMLPNERDMDILLMYREKFSQRSIGIFFGVSDGRVHQIIKRWADLLKEMDEEDAAEQAKLEAEIVGGI